MDKLAKVTNDAIHHIENVMFAPPQKDAQEPQLFWCEIQLDDLMLSGLKNNGLMEAAFTVEYADDRDGFGCHPVASVEYIEWDFEGCKHRWYEAQVRRSTWESVEAACQDYLECME